VRRARRAPQAVRAACIQAGCRAQRRVSAVCRVVRLSTVDGTSLTVCDVDHTEGTFNFMLIAFTQQKIIIPKKAVGDVVNLEVDVIAKYVEQSLAAVVSRVEALEKRLDSQ
jgi:riboflavin synthase alpha subunit